MKLTTAALAIGFLSGAALAQDGFVDNSERTLRCEDHNRDSGRIGRCAVSEQTFASTGSVRVNAEPNGGVTVKGWNQPGVLVRSKVEAWSETADDAQALLSSVQVHAAPDDITATGPASEGDRGWSVSYEVFVPHKTGLNVQTTNGGVHVTDVGGTLNLNTTNGGLHLTRVEGAVTAATTNGGVHVELMGDHWEGSGLEVSATNGSVRVSVPQSYSARFEGSSVNGNIRSDFAELSGAQVSVPGERTSRLQSVSGSLGRGGAGIRATTTNGSLAFERQ